MTGQGVWWRRVLVAGTAGLVLAGGLIAPTVAASPGDRIGTGKRTCVPGPGVDCRDVDSYSNQQYWWHHCGTCDEICRIGAKGICTYFWYFD